jgi:hypothetical protein
MSKMLKLVFDSFLLSCKSWFQLLKGRHFHDCYPTSTGDIFDKHNILKNTQKVL